MWLAYSFAMQFMALCTHFTSLCCLFTRHVGILQGFMQQWTSLLLCRAAARCHTYLPMLKHIFIIAYCTGVWTFLFTQVQDPNLFVWLLAVALVMGMFVKRCCSTARFFICAYYELFDAASDFEHYKRKRFHVQETLNSGHIVLGHSSIVPILKVTNAKSRHAVKAGGR